VAIQPRPTVPDVVQGALTGHRRGHVGYASAQARGQIRAIAVGKIDELHNLDLGTRVGAEASDQIKYLSERIPATFVLAGVDLEGNGLFAGRRGGQIASRYSLIRTSPFPYGTDDERVAWQALVATLENALRLHAHRRGALLRLSGYLHERTGGMIGSLSHLIREAALDAILNQTEKINQAGLDTVDLDQTAEHHRTIQRRRRRTASRTPAP
jgi:hypothetical protein